MQKRAEAGTQEMQAIQGQVLQGVGSRVQAVRAEEEQMRMIQTEDPELHRKVVWRWAKAGLWKEEGALPQYETNTVADNSGPETTEKSQLGGKQEKQECKLDGIRPATVQKRAEDKAAKTSTEGQAQETVAEVQEQVLQRVGSRARTGRAEEERQGCGMKFSRWQRKICLLKTGGKWRSMERQGN